MQNRQPEASYYLNLIRSRVNHGRLFNFHENQSGARVPAKNDRKHWLKFRDMFGNIN